MTKKTATALELEEGEELEPKTLGQLDFLITLWRKDLTKVDMDAINSIKDIIDALDTGSKDPYKITSPQTYQVAVVYEFKLDEYRHFLEIVQKMREYFDLKHAEYLMDDPLSFRVTYEIGYVRQGSSNL